MSIDCIVSCSPVVSIRSKVKQARNELANSFTESPRKNPVTQQFVAQCLAAEKNGIVINHSAKQFFPNVLYDSTIKLITMICSKYVSSSQVDLDDLVQSCFLRIMKHIGTFNSKRARFSTWCWKVCSSEMNSRYRNRMRYHCRFVDGEDIEKYSNKIEDTTILTKDIADTIRAIAKKYPKKKHILYGMFGNPNKSSFCLPTKVKMSKVARDIGAEYSDVYTFYKKVVQKIFNERFNERKAA